MKNSPAKKKSVRLHGVMYQLIDDSSRFDRCAKAVVRLWCFGRRHRTHAKGLLCFHERAERWSVNERTNKQTKEQSNGRTDIRSPSVQGLVLVGCTVLYLVSNKSRRKSRLWVLRWYGRLLPRLWHRLQVPLCANALQGAPWEGQAGGLAASRPTDRPTDWLPG